MRSRLTVLPIAGCLVLLIPHTRRLIVDAWLRVTGTMVRTEIRQ